MLSSLSVRRITSFSKIAKINTFLLISLMIAATMSISFATNGHSNDCGARVALVLDRSSSIGVDQFSGNRAQSNANIKAIREGSYAFVDAVIGKDSYMDVYGFATVAQRINTAPSWFNVKDQDHANLQKLVIGSMPFKTGAKSTDMDAYNDGMQAAGEGLTNWQHALQYTVSTRQDPLPTHIVIFTDGNPTTHVENMQRALNAGGSFTAAGLPNEDGVHGPDVLHAIHAANILRAWGVKIIPVAVGAEGIVNMANLQALAGPGNPVYRSNSYAGLVDNFKKAAANVCEPPSDKAVIAVKARDTEGNPLAIPVLVGSDRTIGGPSTQGEVKTTSVNPNEPWTAAWAFDTTGTWRARLRAQQVPAGYAAVEDRCRRNNWDGPGAVDLPEVEGTADIQTDIILDPIESSGFILCEFVFKKLTTGQAIEKSVSPTVAAVGQEVTYTITVRNTGETTLSNVVVVDETLAKEVTIAGPIVPGKTASTQIKHTITADNFGDNGQFTNVACIKGTQTCDDAIVNEPAIELEKSGPESAKPGDEVTYTFVVKNVGGTDLTNIRIDDATLSEYTDEPVVLQIDGVLKAGETSAPIEYVFTIPADFEEDVFDNVAIVHSNPIDPETNEPKTDVDVTDEDDHQIVIEKTPSIAIEKTADKESAVEGETVKYTFVVTNTGNVTLKNIGVTDNVLGDLGEIDELLPGQTGTKTVEYIVPQGAAESGVIRNVATACFEEPVSEDNCASDDHELTVVAVQGQVVEKPPVQVASLPFTGSSSTWLAGVASVILGIGSVLFGISRRRRKAI